MSGGRAETVRGWMPAVAHFGAARVLLRLAEQVRPGSFSVLSYHRVNDEDDPFFGAVPTAVFEAQMRYVARVYAVLPVHELVERARRRSLPRSALAITFDDGYRDTLTHAAPILARHGLPATVFLATGFIGTAEVPWFDRLARAFKKTRASSLVTPWGEELPLIGQDQRVDALERTLAYLKGLPDEDLRTRLETLLATLGVTDQRCFKDLMLNWDDVQALRGLGLSIGAHTVNHPILSRVSPDRARMEIMGSRTMIEAACGVPAAAFAYPNGQEGDYTPAVIEMVREAGFRCAVTTRFGINTSRTSPWELRRGGPWEQDLATFALKLAWYRLFG